MLSRSPSKVVLSANDIPKPVSIPPSTKVAKLSSRERIVGSGLGSNILSPADTVHNKNT